jgi:hypothetical protein
MCAFASWQAGPFGRPSGIRWSRLYTRAQRRLKGEAASATHLTAVPCDTMLSLNHRPP